MNEFKFKESILFIILVELKFFTKKTNYDTIFDNLINHKIKENDLKQTIREKLKGIFINFLKISKYYHNRNQIKKQLTITNDAQQPLYIPKINTNSKELSAKREKHFEDKGLDKDVIQCKGFNGDYQDEKVKDIILYRNNVIKNIIQQENEKDKDKDKERKNSSRKSSKLRYELFEKQEKERKNKLVKMKETLLGKEIIECNFTPKINEVSNHIFRRPDSHLKIRNKISINELLKTEEQNLYNSCLSKKTKKESKFNSNCSSPKGSKENNPNYIKEKIPLLKFKRFIKYPNVVIDMTDNQLLEIKNFFKADMNPHDIKDAVEP